MKNTEENKEDRVPKDSEQSKANKNESENGKKAVVKPEDKVYKEKEADIKNPAKTREQGEQPVHPVKHPPKKE